MLAIAIELLAGRYTAMQFNDRSRPEWPPHPARLYSAMVAAWADADQPDPAERAALCWIEAQGAPEIHCGEPGGRAVVTHFVPVNDATALTRNLHAGLYASVEGTRRAAAAARLSGDAKALLAAEESLGKAQAKARADAGRADAASSRDSAKQAAAVVTVLPENRGRQPRTYPTIIPDRPAVWFVWPSASPGAGVRAALDGLLSRVARLGHSSTLVACRCAETGPDTRPAWVPGGAGGPELARVRVPRLGLLDRLELAFQVHGGEEPRTLPAGMVSYQRPAAPPRRAPTPHLGGDWYVLGFAGPRFPAAARALAVARAARGALMAHGEQPPAAIICGHQPGAGVTPPATRTHLAVVPLLNAGHARSDGAIFGIALVLPADCTARERQSVEAALRGWAGHGQDGELSLTLPGGDPGRAPWFALQDLGVEPGGEPAPGWLTPLAGRRKATTRHYWCRPARRWLSVTPVALDRFPGNVHSAQPATRDKAEAEAAAGIVQACLNAGLAAAPSEVASVTIRLDSPLAGIPASPAGRATPARRHYPAYRPGSGTPRACVHAEIEFAEPVAGPVLIGAGRFLGYGLFLPSPDHQEDR